ncbi:MAG: haloacid dehalogenase-like hydrolase [Alphaproteobacteria bacterium]|nr:haloacid dehalogenase-like hydrolase [Alphaproteobacteria bacterium]
MPAATAAYFRVEGVLVGRRGLSCAAWMAARQHDLVGRLGRLGVALAAAPVGAAGDPLTATRLAWRALKDCTEDRLVVLAAQYWDDRVERAWNPAGVALLERCRAQGDRIVLLSEHPEAVIGPIRGRLGADELVCNHLELASGRLTGRLLDPVFAGVTDGSWVREHARRHGLDPARSRAYGTARADATLLSGVGLPCAVTPDLPLRRLAATFDWPVVEARPES